MHKNARTHRRIAGFVLLMSCALFGSAAHADTVFKCRSADGVVAYQDRACAKSQMESQVEIAPPPAVAVSPDSDRVAKELRTVGGHGGASRRSSASRNGAAPRRRNAKPQPEVLSYECHASNGELFYRHGACPKQISAKSKVTGASKRKRGASDSQAYSVTAKALPRGDVCRQIARAGSIGRAGHDRDENVSTYDRNLGRDPCRRF